MLKLRKICFGGTLPFPPELFSYLGSFVVNQKNEKHLLFQMPLIYYEKMKLNTDKLEIFSVEELKR
jgi:hypothetical protein